MKTQTAKHTQEAGSKVVEFSYATSDNAKQFGFYKTGCYTVEVWHAKTLMPTALSGHATRQEAVMEAMTIALPWNSLFLRYNPDIS